MFECKSVRADFKAGSTKYEFEAMFSVYGNIDGDGDRILADALAPALEKNGNPPIVWTHRWDDPPIGETLEAKSTGEGAFAKGKLFGEDSERAREVWAGIKSGALNQYSYAFGKVDSSLVELKDGEETARNDGRVREIKTIGEIFEWGPTLIGANRMTGTLAVAKSFLHRLSDDELFEEFKARLKYGSRNSESDQTRIQTIHDLAVEMGVTCDTGSNSPGMDDGDKSGKPKGEEEKAAWTRAYIDSLPDSAFLYIEDGGQKDGDDRTSPSDLRHWPVRDADGKPDAAHVRDALSRIPQTYGVSDAAKEAATRDAHRLLDTIEGIREGSPQDTDDKGKAAVAELLLARPIDYLHSAL